MFWRQNWGIFRLRPENCGKMDFEKRLGGNPNIPTWGVKRKETYSNGKRKKYKY